MPDQGSGPPLVPRTAKIIHARIDSRFVGVNYPVDLSIIADVKETALALVEAVKSMLTKERLAAIRQERWAATKRFTDGLRQAYLAAARDRWGERPLTWPRPLPTGKRMTDEDAGVV